MKRFLAVAAGMLLILAGHAGAEEADTIMGQWYTKDAKALVDIYRCDDLYCGKIVWLKEPKNDDGTDKLDDNNPDEAKRTHRIIGLDLVKNFTYKGNGKWEKGTIYDPDNGKTYSCRMSLSGDELKVRGFIGVSLIGRTQIWKRKP